jgi:predicted DNA-binding transcriptional regulator AlpA
MRRPALPLEPRGLQREIAAGYVGLSATKFDELVSEGQMPQPKLVGRRKIWDRVALDRAFEALPSNDDTCDIASGENTLERLLRNGARGSGVRSAVS